MEKIPDTLAEVRWVPDIEQCRRLHERKGKTMTQTNVNETVWNLAQSARETSQAIAQSAVEAQERNMRYAQSIWTNGTEVLKSHVDSTRSLVETVIEQTQKPQEV